MACQCYAKSVPMARAKRANGVCQGHVPSVPSVPKARATIKRKKPLHCAVLQVSFTIKKFGCATL